ncbi:hypothetical protein ILUMI_05369 [Ignelater luminosus]|uniref:Uncharacterized protein n=1 Tax=Ignelater luminosus TaxID=2038154 RepID=A0A8K0D793_IGNLU|nr:hypothetical protein ILUMI_05369 [Ignelater luminosus]
MKQIVVFLLFTLMVNVSFAEKLPPDYQTCKQDDPNFSKCLENAIQDAFLRLENGIPSLNVPPLHPLRTPSLTIGEGNGAVNVKQHYTNFNVYNFGKGRIEKFNVKLTSTDFKLELEIKYSEVRVESDYSLDGKVLSLPIVGNGKCVVKFINSTAKVELQSETYEKKGDTYLRIKDLQLKIIPEKLTFNFENLFNGDVQLGDTMNKLLNENWEVLYQDIEEPIVEATAALAIDYANRILSKVPYHELF